MFLVVYGTFFFSGSEHEMWFVRGLSSRTFLLVTVKIIFQFWVLFLPFRHIRVFCHHFYQIFPILTNTRISDRQISTIYYNNAWTVAEPGVHLHLPSRNCVTHQIEWSFCVYSQTCVQQPPLGPQICGHCSAFKIVVAVGRWSLFGGGRLLRLTVIEFWATPLPSSPLPVHPLIKFLATPLARNEIFWNILAALIKCRPLNSRFST